MTGWRPPCVQHRSAETQPSLFDLAPGGACHASRVAARAVRSYRTLSPLPRKRGGLLSVALSLKRPKPPRRALPGTVPSWSPDFPRTPSSEESNARDRPAFRRGGCRALRGKWEWEALDSSGVDVGVAGARGRAPVCYGLQRSAARNFRDDVFD